MQMATNGLMRMAVEDAEDFQGPTGNTKVSVLEEPVNATNSIKVGTRSHSQQSGDREVASYSAMALSTFSAYFQDGKPHTLVISWLVGFVIIGLILSTCAAIASTMARRRMLERRTTGEVEEGDEVDEDEDGVNEGMTQQDVQQAQTRVEREMNRSPEGLDEDIYGMGIAVIIRDSQRLAKNTPLAALRCTRVTISVLVLLFTGTMQVFILFESKHLVTSQSTHETRDIYDQYEIIMYGNTTDGLRVNENGYHRGVDGHFNADNFAKLGDELRDSVCQLPLSQPSFCLGVLLIWTFLCAAEMRGVMGMGAGLLIQTPTIASMADSCRETPESGDEAVLVEGLTVGVKALIAVCILIPRLVASCVLLWLGCRWLVGTLSFSDVMQNVVTLGFVLLLKNIFYTTMAPHHNKLETRNTLILPQAKKENPSAVVLLGAFFWGILSIVWVILYVEVLQQVLPEYNWDVHDACKQYLLNVEAGTAAAER